MSDWIDDAACGGVDVALFFPEEGEHPTTALEVCSRCPVREPCLAEALANNEPHGVWGGMTPRQRNRLRRGAQIPRRRRRRLAVDGLTTRARLIAIDARRWGIDPVQAVATRLMVTSSEARDLLERSPLDP